jgi:hypothetical protein
VNYYDGFMEPGALPLQYVDMPPDYYIPMLFTSIRFGDSSDLKNLYAQASKFFVPTNPAPANPETPGEPTDSPTTATATPGEPTVSPTPTDLSAARKTYITAAVTLIAALTITMA